MEPFAADFSSVDHAAIARAYGLAAFRPVPAAELYWHKPRGTYLHDHRLRGILYNPLYLGDQTVCPLISFVY
ncbi:hypothetical protein, partial [Acetomicrobium sp. S15 = DSM 107314]|uniref:hypothetical protein n=1 Tax=Acetomicrobium sp. S15 = DSM 107314 TaxID=2529858 RepID=UPI001E2C96AC